MLKNRTEKFFPFEVIGTDYAGPIYHKTKTKVSSEHISYYFPAFIKSFKRLISRGGKPKIVYSDNAKTFKASAKWLANINRDHKLHDFLNSKTIIWKLNVPKAPWWGGPFERLISLIKVGLFRNIKKAQLTWAELEEVLLDIAIILNNRPLIYVEQEIYYPSLTPNSLILGRDVNFPDAAPHESESETIKKQQKYIKRSKEALCKKMET